MKQLKTLLLAVLITASGALYASSDDKKADSVVITEEIAKLLNISEGTSKSQLFKARKVLQQKIKELNKADYGTN